MPLILDGSPIPDQAHENKRHSSGRKRRHQENLYRTFALAHPAPIYIDKTHLVKHLKSRQFLQVQKVSPDTNHYTPDIDVISFAPPKDPIRLVSALKGLLEGKISLRDGRLLRFNKDDVLLTRYREDDQEPQEAAAQPPRNGSIMEPLEKIVGREVQAVLRKDNKIILEDGRLWTATNHQNRSFEFITTDEHGVKTVMKWVLSKRRISGLDDHPSSSSAQAPETTFHFSIIRPNTRKHAVLASLTQSSLQIKESYYEPVNSFGTSDDFDTVPKVVDDATRSVITATAVWVVLTLGWSPTYKASAVDRQDSSWRCASVSRPTKHSTW